MELLEKLQLNHTKFLDDFMDSAMIDNVLNPNKKIIVDNRKFCIVDIGNDHNTLAWCDTETDEIFTNEEYKPGIPLKAEFKRWATGFDV